MSTARLAAIPELGGLYASALARTLKGGRRGSSLPDTRLEVDSATADPGKLLGYQRLLGETVDDTLPAGYVHTLTFPLSVALMNRPDFPVTLFGLVHLTNEIEYLRPLKAGDVMGITSWMENLRPHRKGVQLDAIAEVRIGPDLYWRGTSTYLARGAQAPPDMALVETQREEIAIPELPTAIWKLGADTGRRYAKVSGDSNPIHLTPLTARMLGFKRQIVHGMYSAGRALAAVGAGRGESYRWTVEFFSPVFLPSTVSLRVEPEAGGHRYVGWNGAKQRLHFAGAVTRL